MAMIADEVLKAMKCKELETKYGNVRKGLRMSLVAFLKDNPNYEKLIEGFVGIDPADKKTESKRNFLDELGEISKLMDDAFNKLGDAEDGALAHKLTTVSAIYMERIGQTCLEAKTNYFPMHKEKFAMYVSEDQEAKAIVPRTTLKTIKNYLDKWFFLMQQYSVNAKAKIIYTKLNDFRDKLHHFEYVMGKSVNKLQREYVKEIIPFMKDTKLALLRMRKFFEAIDASAFGKMIKALTDVAMENGTRVYVKYNAVLTIVAGNVRKGSVIPVQTIVDKYDNVMFPIRQTVAELDTKLGGSRAKDPAKAFWDIASQITSFRDGMHSVIDEFSKGISPSDEDFKFFTHTAQAVLIPYMNQTKGEVNDTFINGVRNLDTFFWKIMTKAIENSQEKGEKMDEIVGLAVRITQKELDGFLSENKELADDNLAEEIENASSSSEK